MFTVFESVINEGVIHFRDRDSMGTGGLKPPYPRNSIGGKGEGGGERGKEEEEERGRGRSPS